MCASFRRFVACLKAGMEVSLAAREDLSSLGMTPAPLGVYRLHAHHAHTKAPYLAGCWRPPPPHAPATPVLTPRYKEELLACCPAVGDAATLARLAASTPIATPLVLGYTHTLPQDTTLMYAHPPTDLHRVAPDMGTAFGQESMGHESSLTAAHTHAHTLTHTHQEVPAPHGHAPRRGHAPRSRRAPGHTHAITHPADTAHGLDTTQERGSSRLSPMPARQAPSGDPRTTKWPGRSLHRRAPNDPSTPWRPDPAVVDRGARQTACVAPCQDALSARDLAEITQLQQSYQGNMDAMAGPLEEQVPRGELEQLYTWFIERRAKFLVSTPLYTTVAAADRPKLLHVAVAMSTYITGAHHMDTADFSWRQRRGAGREVAVLSASSVRQLLSHQQFLHVMKFYTTYGEALADQTVAILMQVMSLFYPEEGLHAPAPVEEGRLHYLGLLSRYLAVSQGPREAACCLATLLTSQQEAHQLVQLLRQVDLKPWVPRTELATSRDMLAHRIHLVCEAARARPCPEATTPPPWPRQAPEGTVEHMGRIVSLLARCEDPRTLALARRILPKPLPAPLP
ncbi:hypothetical protein GWK47_021163 [Chionoecetes opilio]|uniref:Uncharacterized protein n=1 Tax=Chionoecetes opilio TaxID=41210 RepID=A0A8J4XNQ9_CHIOP|nr:hypothetical protein GWK47_021163 [Chionoecetes opilio]